VYAATSYTLAEDAFVEVLSTATQAATAAIDLTGNALANLIVGNAGVNVLDGKRGADTLVGLGGADEFRFTTALGSGNVDRLLDFEPGTDRIALDDAVFVGLARGALSASAFVLGSAAQDAADRIIYNPA